MSNSPKTHELALNDTSGNHGEAIFFNKKVVNSRRQAYKGGRKLPSAEVFANWRSVEGKSLGEIEDRLQKYSRESTSRRRDGIIINFPDGYLLRYLMELEYGRFKSPGWFMMLMEQALGKTLPWWTQYDGNTDAEARR